MMRWWPAVQHCEFKLQRSQLQTFEIRVIKLELSEQSGTKNKDKDRRKKTTEIDWKDRSNKARKMKGVNERVSETGAAGEGAAPGGEDLFPARLEGNPDE